MKIGIYSSIYSGNVIDKTISYIAVDNGVRHLLNQHIEPLYIIGDLDSLDDKKLIENYMIKQYPVQKDDTDTALAIKDVIAQGYDEIDLYGVTNHRLDHFLSVLCLLRKYANIKITIYDQQNKIYLLNKGYHKINKNDYSYFSLFSYEPTYITLKDCYYPLNHYLLMPTDSLCTSNQMNESHAIIETNKDILVIQSK